MHTRTRFIAAAAVLAALALASPAAAHQGHASCKGAAHGFIVPLAQSGQTGETASSLGQAGMLDDNVATAHASLCTPKG